MPGIGGGMFAAIKDVVEIAVLAALAYAYWRRFVLKPRRLEANREALLILTLILAIMITDLLFDGFRFALFADDGSGHRARARLSRSPAAASRTRCPDDAGRAGGRLSRLPTGRSSSSSSPSS